VRNSAAGSGEVLIMTQPARIEETPYLRSSHPRRTIDTLKGQLDLERHGGHTPAGVLIRVLQRILALTATIWHNDRASRPVKRSLLAYDH